MKNFRLFLFSLVLGFSELFLLDQARIGLHRFFRERPLPGQDPAWGRRLPRRTVFAEHRQVSGGRR